MADNYFIEIAKTINDSTEILNWYRNLYYTEDSNTERGIMARAINEIWPEYSRQKAEIKRLTEQLTQTDITKLEHGSLCETDTYKVGD